MFRARGFLIDHFFRKSSSTANLSIVVFFRKCHRSRVWAQVDRGFSTNQKFQPKKNNQKTAGTKCSCPQLSDVICLEKLIIHGKFINFELLRKLTSRCRVSTRVDEGFPTKQKFQPKKKTKKKTAGTKCFLFL